MEALGVDIGGVLIQPADSQPSGKHGLERTTEDTSFFGPNFLRTSPMPGAFDGLAALVDTRFGGNVHLVSKCGEQTEARTRAWLAHHGFFARTGIPPGHLHFCRTRPAKAPIAADLGLTHFVDDKLEVLSYLTTVEHRFLFRPRQAEVDAYAAHLAGVRRVETWPELVAALCFKPAT